MADDSMPPKPETYYNFEIPFGVDTNDTNSDDQESVTDYRAGEESHTADHDTTHVDSCHDLDNAHDEECHEPKLNKGLLSRRKPSDNEEGDSIIDRNQADQPSGLSLTKGKKSPRRSEFDNDEDTNPKPKRPRPSLFGGPVMADEYPEDDLVEQEHQTNSPKTPGYGIRDGLHTLNLDQEERETSPSECSFKFGFGLASSDGDDLSPRESPIPSDESVIIPPDDRPVYDLRQNIERRKAHTYIDTDKSGNFDPEAEGREKMMRLNKARAAKAAQKQQKKKGKTRAPKEHVLKCIVKLQFEEAYGNVRNLIDDEQNWPDNWSVVSSDYEREMEDLRSFHRRNTPGRKIQSAINDPRGEFDDITGHPEARGCKICRKLNQPCSLTTGGAYPCTDCIEEGTVCELIIPPAIKSYCKQCLEGGKEYCSFQDHADQESCDYCVGKNSICIAIPPHGYKPKRVDIDKKMYGENRPFADCDVCRKAGKECSLKKKKDKPPCKYCKKRNIGCTFYETEKPNNGEEMTEGKGKEKAQIAESPRNEAPRFAIRGSPYFTAEELLDMEDSDHEIETRESTPEIEMDDNFGRCGMLTKIRTAFAHPLEFNSSLPDCSFCELPAFGMTGHSEREVHVIRWHNGLGFSEVAGGFHEYAGPTRMCEACTVTRLQPLVCPGHQIGRIFDAAFQQSFDEAVDALITAEPRSLELQHQYQRWCSMCFSLATYGCLYPQPSVCGEEEEMINGCGLKLCDRCEAKLRDECGGDVDLTVMEMEKLPKPNLEDETCHPQGLARADVGFMRSGGLLMRNLEANNI